MADYITMRSGEGWVLGGTKPKLDASPIPSNLALYISDPEAWKQYADKDLYCLEVLLREWIKEMSTVKSWKNNARNRRYTMKMIWPLLFGREYDSKRDAKYVNKLSKLLAYYSTRVQKQATINGKSYQKTVYALSPKRLEKLPYSLKLRFEYLCEQGIVPNKENMKMPKDLKPGHARNPRTEENMRLAHEEGLRRYNEWKANHKEIAEQLE